jgi:hypothetical protein
MYMRINSIEMTLGGGKEAMSPFSSSFNRQGQRASVGMSSEIPYKGILTIVMTLAERPGRCQVLLTS